MRKDEVEFHSEGFGRGSRPAVNVKVYARVDSAEAIGYARVEDPSLDPRFEEWYREQLDEEDGTYPSQVSTWWEWACENGWENLQADAEEVFGPRVKVYSEGRSGGWAVVDGLPDFETWDAIDLGKWARFAKYARAAADDIPSMMAVLASINTFQSFLDEQARLMTGPSMEAVR